VKLAITADVHLTSEDEYPERYHALQDIVKKSKLNDIDHIIIAGDLFDKDFTNYSEFEDFVKNQPEMNFIIIPGNHDSQLNNKMMTTDNIEVIDSPKLRNFSKEGFPIFFLPYKQNKAMGDIIAENSEDLLSGEWILISHGNWAGAISEPNPNEPGTYMPLSRNVIQKYNPLKVVLGHIHKTIKDNKICYPGSPCGLNINETGRRYFTILDDKTGSVEYKKVDSEILYFNEALTVIPVENEENFIKNQIDNIIKDWDLDEKDKRKSKIRIKVNGVSSNKRKLERIIRDGFKNFEFYDEIDLEDVHLSEDFQLSDIANKVVEKIDEMEWVDWTYDPSRDEIIQEALKVIYGV